jgi:hypothetical protein
VAKDKTDEIGDEIKEKESRPSKWSLSVLGVVMIDARMCRIVSLYL